MCSTLKLHFFVSYLFCLHSRKTRSGHNLIPIRRSSLKIIPRAFEIQSCEKRRNLAWRAAPQVCTAEIAGVTSPCETILRSRHVYYTPNPCLPLWVFVCISPSLADILCYANGSEKQRKKSKTEGLERETKRIHRNRGPTILPSTLPKQSWLTGCWGDSVKLLAREMIALGAG